MTTLREVHDMLSRLGVDHDSTERNDSYFAKDDEIPAFKFFPKTLAGLVYRVNVTMRQLDRTQKQNALLVEQNQQLREKNTQLHNERDMGGYQAKAMRTYVPSGDRDAMLMTALGLAGEAGEVAEMIKKHIFHGKPLDKEELAKELGDVLWYLAVMARTTLNMSLGRVARLNIEKLLKRYPDGFKKVGE